MPVSAVVGRSGDVNGNAAARASVSNTRFIPSASNARGRPVIQPCNCRHVAGATSSSYSLTAADAGLRVRLLVKSTNANGTTTAASAPTSAVAALRGFATMEGTADAVMLLAKAAVQAKGGPEKDAARASLAAMRGATVDDAIMAAIPGAEATIRNELILSLGQRAVKGAKPLLFRLAADADPAVQNAALGALGEVAGVNDYPAAAKLLLETKNDAVRGAAENLVVRLARQVPTEGDRTAPLLAGVVGAPVETKISLLKVLGAMGGTAALNAVRAELKSDDPKVQDATVRALAATPDAAALNDLLDIAKSSQNKVHRVLALRGYLRLVDASAGRAGADLKLYEPVIPLATDASEKKTLISGLGRINSPEALAVVAPMLDDEAVRNEAASAVIGMARGISGKNPREARTALEKVVALVKDEAIVKQANDVLKGIPAS